jgi:hypothetical protein
LGLAIRLAEARLLLDHAYGAFQRGENPSRAKVEKRVEATEALTLARREQILCANCAPVMLIENGLCVMKPMRCQCPIADKPSSYDAQYPATYIVRRDIFEGFWKPRFRHTHGVMFVDLFYEDVRNAKFEGTLLEIPKRDKTLFWNFTRATANRCLWRACGCGWSALGEPDLRRGACRFEGQPLEFVDSYLRGARARRRGCIGGLAARFGGAGCGATSRHGCPKRRRVDGRRRG